MDVNFLGVWHLSSLVPLVLVSGTLILSSLVPHMHEGGADIRFIQKLLGHASLETTAIYTEMNVESLRQVFASCHPTEKRWKEKQC